MEVNISLYSVYFSQNSSAQVKISNGNNYTQFGTHGSYVAQCPERPQGKEIRPDLKQALQLFHDIQRYPLIAAGCISTRLSYPAPIFEQLHFAWNAWNLYKVFWLLGIVAPPVRDARIVWGIYLSFQTPRRSVLLVPVQWWISGGTEGGLLLCGEEDQNLKLVNLTSLWCSNINRYHGCPHISGEPLWTTRRETGADITACLYFAYFA